MDLRIRHEHIANEAKRIARITGRQDNDANWYEAVENLNIFPSTTYDIGNMYHSSTSEHSFGIIRRGYWTTSRYMIWWHSCRETFERDLFALVGPYHGNFKFGFVIDPTMHDQECRVAHFIRDIELNKLNLNKLTTFMRVRNKSYVYIRPSSFWTSCQMRFSLFTILLRAGRHYFFNSIEDALLAEPYSRHTFAAIRLFFEGRRNFTGVIDHWQTKWVGYFNDLHESQITCLSY